MIAAILTELNAPLAIEEVGLTQLTYGQVLVRVIASGICGAQLQEVRGEKGGPLPHLLGHEGVATVEEIGAGVTRMKVGDKVVMHWRVAAGIESDFPEYVFRGQRIRSGKVTTFSEMAICSENRLTPIPHDTETATAVLLGCSLSTAMATVEREAKWGERVLVIGCGGLGLSLLAALNMVEPRSLCACDINEEKRASAEIAGAEYANVSAGVFPEGAHDLILDTAGNAETMERALEHLAPNGRYVMIGQPAPGKPVCIRGARHMFDGEGKTIKATQGGGFRPEIDLPRYLKIAAGLRLWPLVTHKFPLAQINDALDVVRTGHAGRVLIEMIPSGVIERAQTIIPS